MKKIFLSVKINLVGRENPLQIKRIFNIKPYHCAQYTRLMVENLFDIKYPIADAWELLYVCNVSKFDINKIKPGDIILCENPKSKFKGEKDSKNNIIVYTHTSLYLGIEKETNLIYFVHQYSSEQEIVSYEELRERGLTPKFIIRPK